MDSPAEVAPLKQSRRAQKNLLREDLNGTSIHGLSKATGAKSTKHRCFWGGLFLCALVGFIANLYALAKRYHEQPILTQINHEHDNFVWPHVTICNPLNPIPFWRWPHLRTQWRKLIKRTKRLPHLYYNGTKGRIITRQMLAMSSINNVKFFDSAVKLIVQSVALDYVDKTITTTVANMDKFRNVLDFSEAFDVRLETSRSPLPCYTLKPELFTQQNITSTNSIRRIRLFLIMDFKSYNFFNSGHENRKIYLYIGHPWQTLQTSPLFYIYAGSDSHFELSEFSVKRIKGCITDQKSLELYNVFMNETKKYNGNFQDCISEISQRTFIENCGCHNPFLPIVKVADSMPRLCLNMSLFNDSEIRRNVKCINQVSEHFSKHDRFQKVIDNHCGKYEMPYCRQTFYNIIRNSNKWQKDLNPERRFLLRQAIRYLPNAQNRNVTDDFLHLNLAGISLLRKHGKTPLTFEEFEYPISQLLSDIGGTMGLWLGVSVISVLELCVIVYDFINYMRMRNP